MSHGIQEFDRGCVWGTTWHRIPSYVTQDKPVSIEQAREVLDFPVSKRPLFFTDADDNVHEVDAWALVRDDHNTCIVPSVGSRFEVVPNVDVLNVVQREVLDPNPNLDIESVGTLFNGATSFVNLKLKEFQVKGDESQTLSRLMYYNPLGLGCYRVGAHNVRIVCNNTLKMATDEAVVNGSLTRYPHVRSSRANIAQRLVDLAAVMSGVEENVELMNHLASQPVVAETLRLFLDTWLPMSLDTPESASSHLEKMRMATTDEFAASDYMDPATGHSKYGLLQAATYVVDHMPATKVTDDGAMAWDCLVGGRMERKVQALNILQHLG